MPSQHAWHSAARTHRGKVRTGNEDAFLDRPERGMWAVADGMGGHVDGARASRMIVDSLAALPTTCGFEARLNALRQCLRWLNRRLRHELTRVRGEPGRIIGSTVVTLLIENDRAACVWAGDSRCYLWRGQTLYRLSRDHSLCRQLVEQEAMSPERAARHPSAHALTRAVGAHDTLALDVLELRARPGDTFLLCSDGLHGELDQQHLLDALEQWSPDHVVDTLFTHVLRGRARDNLTAVVIRL